MGTGGIRCGGGGSDGGRVLGEMTEIGGILVAREMWKLRSVATSRSLRRRPQGGPVVSERTEPDLAIFFNCGKAFRGGTGTTSQPQNLLSIVCLSCL